MEIENKNWNFSFGELIIVITIFCFSFTIGYLILFNHSFKLNLFPYISTNDLILLPFKTISNKLHYSLIFIIFLLYVIIKKYKNRLSLSIKFALNYLFIFSWITLLILDLIFNFDIYQYNYNSKSFVDTIIIILYPIIIVSTIMIVNGVLELIIKLNYKLPAIVRKIIIFSFISMSVGFCFAHNDIVNFKKTKLTI